MASSADHHGADKNSMTKLQLRRLTTGYRRGEMTGGAAGSHDALRPNLDQVPIEGLARHGVMRYVPDKPEE
jgi:hypothetical protein